MTWVEYQSSLPGKPPTLGRKVVAKASSKQFKATVAMSEDFPMKVDMLLAVLEVIAPQFKHFNKLRDFVKLKLPPGKIKKVELKCLNSSSQDSRFKSTFLYSPPCQPRYQNSVIWQMTLLFIWITGDFHRLQLGRGGGELFLFL